MVPETYRETVASLAAAAQAVWETFAALDGEELPPDEIDAMQVKLVRWERRNFGLVPQPLQSLGVIEEFGEIDHAKTLDEKLDGLGDICVYIGQLLNGNRLAIRPVIDLAEMLAADWDGNEQAQADNPPAALLGMFAHTVLKREQKIRGYDDDAFWRTELVFSVACLMAHAKLDALFLDATLQSEASHYTCLPDAGLIRRTYIDVATKVVLKRNWAADKLAGADVTSEQ
jgi:hypothetical protein